MLKPLEFVAIMVGLLVLSGLITKIDANARAKQVESEAPSLPLAWQKLGFGEDSVDVHTAGDKGCLCTPGSTSPDSSCDISKPCTHKVTYSTVRSPDGRTRVITIRRKTSR